MKVILLLLFANVIVKTVSYESEAWDSITVEFNSMEDEEEEMGKSTVVNNKKIVKNDSQNEPRSYNVETDSFMNVITSPNSSIRREPESLTWMSISREVNWVNKGAVTSVRNQKGCLASYAIAALDALEGRYYIQNRRLVQLSVQNILDCSKGNGNNGCKSGFIDSTYKYIINNKGINIEKEYPYESRTRKCRFKRKKTVVKLKSYNYIFGEENLRRAVALGPVAVGIDARPESFRHYTSGVYKNAECGLKGMNHAVAVVGYGTDPKTKEEYWLVKNSWGKDWGEKGYMKLLRGVHMCNIGYMGVEPIVPTKKNHKSQ